MPNTKTLAWDPVEHFADEEDMAAYLEAALEEGDPRDAGLGRESLYKALSSEGNPEFGTILKVVAALGLQLHASPARYKTGANK
jgi:DNA-binding phage protein